MRVMRAYGGVEVLHHLLFTLDLDWGGRKYVQPIRFTRAEKVSGGHRMGGGGWGSYVGPNFGRDILEVRQIPCPSW